MAINQMHALVLGLCVYCNSRVTRKRVSIQKESNAGESATTNVLDLNTSNQFFQINKKIDDLQKTIVCCNTIEALDIINQRLKKLEEQRA